MIRLYIFTIVVSVLFLHVESLRDGQFVSITEAPHHVQLSVGLGLGPICGGSIISKRWVITAAHCILPVHPRRYRIYPGISSQGNSNEDEYYVGKQIIVHGYYESSKGVVMDNDIALIKIDGSFNFNEYQYPIPISREPLKAGDKAQVFGFGSQGRALDGAPPSLKKTDLIIMDQNECGLVLAREELRISDKILCTVPGETDVCQGDSGGGLVVNGTLIGLVSWGPSCNLQITDTPGVYTRVGKFHDWIEKHTKI